MTEPLSFRALFTILTDAFRQLPDRRTGENTHLAIYVCCVYNACMNGTRWTTSNKAVFNLGYHIIWCPKYRRKVLVDRVEARLRELLLEKASEIGVRIESLEIMPDHVHLFIKTTPINSPHHIVQQFKGYTSRILRQEFIQLKKRLPTLWTRAYYIESVGHISEDAIRRYIEDQKHQ